MKPGILGPLLLALGGCAHPPPQPEHTEAAPPPQLEPLRQELAQARDQIEHDNRRMAELELQLLEQTAQVLELQRQLKVQQMRLDQAIQEVVRTKSKLRSHESKAETVSSLAEAQIALSTLREKRPVDDPQLLRIEQLILMCTQEIESGNYAGAFYLLTNINDAITELRSTPARTHLGGDVEQQGFNPPLRFELLTRSNVRAQPSIDSAVKFILSKGTTVQAVAHRDLWIQVRTHDDQMGWIFYKLLRAN